MHAGTFSTRNSAIYREVGGGGVYMAMVCISVYFINLKKARLTKVWLITISLT